jgi:Tfp pilus assembly protein PilF
MFNHISIKYFTFFLISLFLISGCSSDKAKIENYLSEAQTYFDNAEYKKAVIQIKNTIKLDGNSIKAYELLAETQLKLRDGQEAFKAFLRLEQIDPENIKYKLQLATFYLLGKQKKEAEKRINHVLEKEPENIEALYLSAGLLANEKENIDQIKAVYLKILDIDPKQAKAHVILARLYGNQKDLKSAEASLKKAVNIDPEIMIYT